MNNRISGTISITQSQEFARALLELMPSAGGRVGNINKTTWQEYSEYIVTIRDDLMVGKMTEEDLLTVHPGMPYDNAIQGLLLSHPNSSETVGRSITPNPLLTDAGDLFMGGQRHVLHAVMKHHEGMLEGVKKTAISGYHDAVLKDWAVFIRRQNAYVNSLPEGFQAHRRNQLYRSVMRTLYAVSRDYWNMRLPLLHPEKVDPIIAMSLGTQLFPKEAALIRGFFAMRHFPSIIAFYHKDATNAQIVMARAQQARAGKALMKDFYIWLEENGHESLVDFPMPWIMEALRDHT